MVMMKFVLSICIPTYNRAKCLEHLLSFVKKEIDSARIAELVEVIISNNCSTDNTEEVIVLSDIYKENNYNVRYIKNESNLGIVGNLKTVYTAACGKYLWVMGDDDYYYDGIIKKIYSEISKDIYHFIFINHSCLKINSDGSRSGFKSVINSKALEYDDKRALVEIFNYSGTSLMFISASVHRTDNVHDAMEQYDVNMAYPLLLSFYSATKGQVKIIEDILIDDILEGISWKNHQNFLFSIECPNVIRTLPKLGYSKQEVQMMLYNHEKRFNLTWKCRIIKWFKSLVNRMLNLFFAKCE